MSNRPGEYEARIRKFQEYHERVNAFLKDLEDTKIERMCIIVELETDKEMDQKRPKIYNRLEKAFAEGADDAFVLANKCRQGQILKQGTDDLRSEIEIYRGNKGKGISGRIKNLYDLNEIYEKATGNRHPDYEKYCDYMSGVANAMDKEMVVRNEMISDFQEIVSKFRRAV